MNTDEKLLLAINRLRGVDLAVLDVLLAEIRKLTEPRKRPRKSRRLRKK